VRAKCLPAVLTNVIIKSVYTLLYGDGIMRQKKARARSLCHCINLRRASTALTEYYDQLLRPGGLTVNQYSLLKNLHRLGVCSLSELAQSVGLERTTLVRNMKPLFKKGLVADISPQGSRNRQIQVTAAGRQALDLCAPLWEKAQQGVEQRIGFANIILLMQLLAEIEGIEIFSV